MKKILFGVAALGLLGLAGAGLGLKAQDTVEAKADVYSGSVTVNVATNWSSAACNVAIYFGDGGSNWAWGSYEAVAKDQILVTVSYSLGFEPSKMSIMRYNSAYDSSILDTDPWNDDDVRWNKIEGLDYNEYVVVTGWGSAESGPYIASDDVYWGRKTNLLGYKINGCEHREFYSETVTLKAGEAFKVVYDAWYGDYTCSALVSGFSSDGDGNIVCGNAGTYALYFDATTHNIYITDPVLAAADEWAQLFLAGVTCDGEGSITKDEWASLSASYAALDDDVKAVFTGIAEDGNDSGTYAEKAACRYDFIVKKYGTTAKPDFMGRKAAGKIDPKASYASANLNNSDGNTIAITIGIGAIAALVIGGAFIARKRRAE